jgi:hypothetical protein
MYIRTRLEVLRLFYAIENLMGYDAMFVAILLALVTDVVEAPVSSIFRVVQANLNIDTAGFPGKYVAIDLLVRRRIPEVFSLSTVTLFSVALRPNARHGLILEVYRSHTKTHHSRWDSSGRVISSSQQPLPDNTQHSQQTSIHAPGGIRTHDLSRRAIADLRLRPRSHWNRPSSVTTLSKYSPVSIFLNSELQLCVSENSCLQFR